MNDIEYLAQQITLQILKLDAGAGKTLADLTENDKDKKIFNSWFLISNALVPYILTHGSGSGGGYAYWGQILGNLQDQTDLYNLLNNQSNQITLVSGSLVTEIQDRINADDNLQSQITLVSGSLVTEIQDRINADDNLQSQITLVSGSLVTEIQDRINEDNNLQSQITLVSGSLVTEIQDRISADDSLQSQIDTLSNETLPTGGNQYQVLRKQSSSNYDVIWDNINIIETFTAGEALSAGNICYLSSDGKFYKTNASSESTSKGLLGLALSSISSNTSGNFLLLGKTTILSGLAAGSTYYLSPSTVGGVTSTQPSTSTQIVRIAGYALSSSIFYFKPSEIYIELA
jgi:predicted DNA-binding ribbon-helix-helix protein